MILDRLQRTLPKGRLVRTQYFYVNSLKKVKELSRMPQHAIDSNGATLSSTVATYCNVELNLRPAGLKIGDSYHGSVIDGRHNNTWGRGDLIAIHNGRHLEMHNFLRLGIGDRIKFIGGNQVLVKQQCPTLSRNKKCIKLYERL